MTLGCSHSLQPTPNDDFVPPSIPALTSRGFVIWQTIQLLLDPEEHVPYLQEAARIFPLINPENNQPFPREIPKEAFPSNPDQETVRWHDEMFAKQSAKEAAAEKKDASKHGKVQVPVPGEHVDTSRYTEYHHHHHHPQYAEQQYASRSRKSRRHPAAAPAPAPDPPVEDERYSRSAPGADQFGRSHSRHHSQHPPEPIFTSDSEGIHSRSHHGRHHSRRGTREREFSKPYVYENGVVTPIVSVFPAVIDLGDGVHILSDQMPSSPPLPPNSHFRHAHPNYHAPTVSAPEVLSCSSSYSDLNGAYHSHHHSPQHLSQTHRDHSRPRSSSPIRHVEPPLRKSQSAYYYAQDPPVHTHAKSRSRSGGSGRRIRQNISDMDSDVSDANIPAPLWAIQAERIRAEEDERENIRRRGHSKDDGDRRHRRPVNTGVERGDAWEYSGGGGGGGGGGSGRSGGSKRYYRVFNPGPVEGLRGAYFY